VSADPEEAIAFLDLLRELKPATGRACIAELGRSTGLERGCRELPNPRPTDRLLGFPGDALLGDAVPSAAEFDMGAFEREEFTDPSIFADGFESGDTSAWDSSVP